MTNSCRLWLVMHGDGSPATVWDGGVPVFWTEAGARDALDEERARAGSRGRVLRVVEVTLTWEAARS